MREYTTFKTHTKIYPPIFQGTLDILRMFMCCSPTFQGPFATSDHDDAENDDDDYDDDVRRKQRDAVVLHFSVCAPKQLLDQT